MTTADPKDKDKKNTPPKWTRGLFFRSRFWVPLCLAGYLSALFSVHGGRWLEATAVILLLPTFLLTRAVVELSIFHSLGAFNLILFCLLQIGYFELVALLKRRLTRIFDDIFRPPGEKPTVANAGS